jgi:predicted DNA-binding protein
MDPEQARHNKAIAERLNDLLDRCGKTKADVARELGKDQGSCTPWFKGTYAPRRQTLLKLAHILDPGWGTQATVRYILSGLSPEVAKWQEWPEARKPKPEIMAGPREASPGDNPELTRLLLEQITKRLDDLAERVGRLERRQE